MKAVEIKENVYWVGGIDWNLRNFHGYITPRGSTYNAYLIIDEKITLIDTVKQYLFDEMKTRISSIIDPSEIDVIISNHVEMDHSGSLPNILDIVPDATVITSTRGKQGLQRHYDKDWKFHVVDSGDSLSIGKRTLDFIPIPMVHWPDSMVTYSKHDKILFPNDAFGQHIASTERFDDLIDWGILYEEAATYYSNIVLPYGGQVHKALTGVSQLDFDIIAPSHGIIWRTHLNDIISAYKRWANNETRPYAVIAYDTMWGSTEKLALAFASGLEEEGINVRLRNIHHTPYSEIIADILEARLIAIGSPTLNNNMLPTVAGFLTYLKGLRPKNRIGFVFGSYGWGGQAVGLIEKMLDGLSWEFPEKSININYIPKDEDLENIKNTGKNVAKKMNQRRKK
ncbi:MAG: FprA family A-type flavoprotein [Candidatus Thermoplasmatota archaeon]|nr:FprA family A-type flavoprotein [Candidatus Thermoplasmatota archaeon]